MSLSFEREGNRKTAEPMWRLSNGLVALAVSVAGLLPGGCREPPREVVYDLAVDAHLARRVHASGATSFVAPPATLYRGRPQGRREGVPPRLVSTAFLRWPDARPRQIVLDIDPPSWGLGKVELTLNRTPLGSLSLDRKRAPYAVDLPANGQVGGRNRLRLTFPGEASGPPPPPSGPPPRLRGVSLMGPGETGAARPVDVLAAPDGQSTLALAAGMGLEYALRLPEAAELRFVPEVVGEPAGPLHFRVELQMEGEPARERLDLALRPGDSPDEVRLALPGGTGRPALLGLHVSAGPGRGVVAGHWRHVRLLGQPEAPEREPSVSSPGVDGLRRRLRGAPVLLIVLDAASAFHFGCYGYGRDTTPEIDRIAAEGFLFERAYTPASYTTLAMSSMWTSQHPEQHHHGVNLRGPLPESRVTLPELLQQQGIPAVAFVGNPNAGRLSALERGFSETWPLRLASKTSAPEPGPSALERMEALLTQDGPVLAYAHYLEPHFPYDPPPPFDTLFGNEEALPPRAHLDPTWISAVNRGVLHPSAPEIAHLKRLYDGNLAAVDHEIGQLRQRLEKAGRWNDLVVVVTADHGETFLQHGRVTHAAQVYEESVRIPLVIKLPGETASTRLSERVDLLDLGATLADVLGVSSEAAGHFQGRSLVPLLAGGTVSDRTIVCRNARERPTYALVGERLTLIHDPRWGGSELYDLEEDPGERHDLSQDRPVTTELLRQSLYRWLNDLDRGSPGTPVERSLSPEDREALRALGYVD
jgi:arylsulfatase A-like enzyme